MSNRNFISALLACFVLFLAACQKSETADQPSQTNSIAPATIFVADKIITMEEDNPTAGAVAVRNGKIVAIGNDAADVQSRIEGPTKIDTTYEDQVLMPGLIDPHLHPVMAAVLLPMEFITAEDWNLPRGDYLGVRTPEGYHKRLNSAIEEFDAENAKETPFFTWGWHHLWHGPITRQMLNEIDPTRPIFVWHRSFHEIITNDAGMAYMGYDTEEKFDAAIKEAKADPGHANYEHGMISESAGPVGLNKLSPLLLSNEHLAGGFAELKQMIRQAGVTTIADMSTGVFTDFDTEAKIMAGAFENDDVPARVLLVPVAHGMAFRTGSVEAAIASMEKRVENWPYKKLLLNNRVKLLSDGAFFSQYMQMNPPGYLDGHEGKWIVEPKEMNRLGKAFWNAGYSIHTHVNGDMGLDVVLDSLEALQAEGTEENQRYTLEHLGFSTEEQNLRIAKLGAAVSAQPNYLYMLSDIYSEMGLGPERAHAISRLGSLERNNVRVAFHSDLTMAPVDPLFLAWIATNRENMEGDVVRPDEKMSLDAGLRAVTIDAAYVLGMEDEVGSIAVGKRADFTALRQDPYEAGVQNLNKLEVSGTVFNGKKY